MKPLIRVIVPAFNAEKTIEKTLDSILAQTYNNLHVIVVDDCSTDGTVSKIGPYVSKGYAPRVVLDVNEKNMGVSATRNWALDCGIPHDLIAYCDADDWWDPDHLEKSLECLQSQNADMVYSTPKWEDEAGNEMFPNWEIPKEFDADKLNQNNYIWISSVLHKPDLGRFDSALNSLEDWDMWLQALRKGWKIVQKPSCTVHYLVRPGTMASKSIGIREKVMEKNGTAEVKLNLGCGDDIMPGWVNVDINNAKADVNADVSKLPFPDNHADVILASHVIEHFTFHNAFKVLNEWKRVLKPGGRIIIETPDLLATCDEFVRGDEGWRQRLYGHFFAFPDESPWQVHYFLYTENQLGWTLQQTGFRNIVRVWPNSTYSRSLPGKERIFLRMEATK